MNFNERDQYERRLLEERDRALADLHRVESEESEPQGSSSGDVPRVLVGADAASIALEEAVDFAVATRMSERLALIDEALAVLSADPDGFTACCRCGDEIGTMRLAVVPWSRLCLACAERLD